jgi:hypothetical protein
MGLANFKICNSSIEAQALEDAIDFAHLPILGSIL